MMTLIFIFWSLLALVVYTYIGYGIILFLLVRIKSLFSKKDKDTDFKGFPSITLIIPAYNEKDYLHEKVTNCFSLLYPKDKFKLIFVTDGSDDGSELFLDSYDNLTVYHKPARAGKMAAMNRVMPYIKTDITIFSDANAILNEDALLNIAKHFENPIVGCVAGEKRILQDDKNHASPAGEGLYWKYESTLKKMSYQLYSTVGAAGELFAIRTRLYEPPAPDVILDDFMISLAVVYRGYTIAYASDAYAMERGSSEVKEEMKRKIRICAGGIQSIMRTLPLLNPFKNPVFAFQYFSHRFLRWTFAPLALLFLLPINLYLAIASGGVYAVFMVLQTLFYAAGLGGWILKRKQIKNKFLFVPFYFLMMNISALLGAKRYFGKSQSVLWEKTKRLKTT